MSELEFLESPVLRTLGEVGLHFLWQGLALGVVTAIVVQAWPRDHRQRHAVLVGALAILMLLPGVTWLWLRGQPESGPATPVAAAGSGVESELVEAGELVSAVKVQSVLASVWISGSVMPAIRWAGGIWWWRRLRNRSTPPVTGAWPETVCVLARQMGIRRTVVLRESRDVSSLVVLGGWRPLILFPAGLLLQLSPDLVRALLIHELAHLRRRDHWVQGLQQIAEVALFFHPVVWWLSEQIRVEREQLCDDESAQWMGDRQVVAEALLSLAEGEMNGSVNALAASGSSLGQRIRRLLGRPLPEPWFNRARPVLGWLVSALVGAGTMNLILTRFQNESPTPTTLSTEAQLSPLGVARLREQLVEVDRRIAAHEVTVDRLRLELKVSDELVERGPFVGLAPDRAEVRWRERRTSLEERVQRGQALLRQAESLPEAELASFLAQESIEFPALIALRAERELARERWAAEHAKRGESAPETRELKTWLESLDSQVMAATRDFLGEYRRQVDADQTELASMPKTWEAVQESEARVVARVRPYVRARQELDTLRRMRESMKLQLVQEWINVGISQGRPL